MPIPPEVDPFQGEVSGNQRVLLLESLLASAREKSQHSAVVSNSSLNGRILRQPSPSAELGKSTLFR